MSTARVRVTFNPNCSKCKSARALLEERGVEASFVRYLETSPTRAELEDLLKKLDFDDPRAMMRPGEPVYAELGLENASRDALFEAIAEHPVLLERPIVVVGDRAVIARPAEKLLSLLE